VRQVPAKKEEEIKMSKIIEYAKSELDRIPKDEDGMQEMMNNDILEILEKFADQGHSGFSASYAISVLERLMRWKPISPLTGEEDEWSTTTGSTRQNIFFESLKNGFHFRFDRESNASR
jgi:hypothetical protein